MKRRFDDLLAELKSEINFKSDYGRVPKGTKPVKPIVERVVPASFLDRWERENARVYPMRERILDAVNTQHLKAAE